MAKEINIPKDIVEKYETKDIINFLTKKLKWFNHKGNPDKGDYNNQDSELQGYIDILSALNDKLNSK